MDGSIFVGPDWVPKNQLAAKLKTIKTESPQKEIVVKGDKRLKYKDVREVMQDAQRRRLHQRRPDHHEEREMRH